MHHPVPQDLGHYRGCRDGIASLVPLDDPLLRDVTETGNGQGVDENVLGPHQKPIQGLAHGVKRPLKDVFPVNEFPVCNPYPDIEGLIHDLDKDPFPIEGGKGLGIKYPFDRGIQREYHGCCHNGSCKRATACLVDAGNQPCSGGDQTPFECEQTL